MVKGKARHTARAGKREARRMEQVRAREKAEQREGGVANRRQWARNHATRYAGSSSRITNNRAAGAATTHG